MSTRYPSYRHSGIEWIGEIPSHWEVSPLRWHIISIEQGWSPTCNNTPAQDLHWGVIKLGAVRNGEFIDQENKALPSGVTPTRDLEIRAGDVLISRANTPELVGDACYVFATRPHLLLSDLVYRVEMRATFAPRFAVYWMISRSGRFPIERDARGSSQSMVKLAHPQLLSIPFAIPPRTEQDAIVAFLDRETARIDGLIEQQARVVALLRERRAAMVSSAVLRGLQDDVPRRSSGVEWIGEIPSHWEVKKIRHVARMESGHTPSRGNAEYWKDCTIPWVSLADVKRFRDGTIDEIHDTDERISELGLLNSSARLLPKGTVILSRTASVGFAVMLGKPMATTQDFANWVCGRHLDSRYLLACLRSMGDEFHRIRQGSVHNTIYMPDIAGLSIPLPPLIEQRAIASRIAEVTARIDATLAAAEEVATLLRARRASLIHSAVTGAVDVRG